MSDVIGVGDVEEYAYCTTHGTTTARAGETRMKRKAKRCIKFTEASMTKQTNVDIDSDVAQTLHGGPSNQTLCTSVPLPTRPRWVAMTGNKNLGEKVHHTKTTLINPSFYNTKYFIPFPGRLIAIETALGKSDTRPLLMVGSTRVGFQRELDFERRSLASTLPNARHGNEIKHDKI